MWPRAGPEEDVRRRRLTATLPVLGDCSQQGLLPDQGLPETDRCLNKRGRVLRTDAKALSCVSWEKQVSFRTVHMICHFVWQKGWKIRIYICILLALQGKSEGI